MKKKVMFLAVAVLIAGVSLVYAQTGTQSKAGDQPNGAQMGQRQGGVLVFSDQLNLTDNQKAEIKSIDDKANAKIAAIQTARTDEINKILTLDQKTKLDQLRKDAQAARAARKLANPAPAGN